MSIKLMFLKQTLEKLSECLDSVKSAKDLEKRLEQNKVYSDILNDKDKYFKLLEACMKPLDVTLHNSLEDLTELQTRCINKILYSLNQNVEQLEESLKSNFFHQSDKVKCSKLRQTGKTQTTDKVIQAAYIEYVIVSTVIYYKKHNLL